MLSTDELNDGIVFILKLLDADGKPVQWVQTLHGTTATRWYDIYQQSDWATLRIEAADIFLNSVSEDEAERVCGLGRCIVIRTLAVKVDELTPRHGNGITALLSPADVRRENSYFEPPATDTLEPEIRQF